MTYIVIDRVCLQPHTHNFRLILCHLCVFFLFVNFCVSSLFKFSINKIFISQTFCVYFCLCCSDQCCVCVYLPCHLLKVSMNIINILNNKNVKVSHRRCRWHREYTALMESHRWYIVRQQHPAAETIAQWLIGQTRSIRWCKKKTKRIICNKIKTNRQNSKTHSDGYLLFFLAASTCDYIFPIQSLLYIKLFICSFRLFGCGLCVLASQTNYFSTVVGLVRFVSFFFIFFFSFKEKMEKTKTATAIEKKLQNRTDGLKNLLYKRFFFFFSNPYIFALRGTQIDIVFVFIVVDCSQQLLTIKLLPILYNT